MNSYLKENGFENICQQTRDFMKIAFSGCSKAFVAQDSLSGSVDGGVEKFTHSLSGLRGFSKSGLLNKSISVASIDCFWSHIHFDLPDFYLFFYVYVNSAFNFALYCSILDPEFCSQVSISQSPIYPK